MIVDAGAEHDWLSRSGRRKAAIQNLTAPLTVGQLASRIGLPRQCCSKVLRELRTRGLVTCLNPSASSNRVHALTRQGVRYRSNRSSGCVSGHAHHFPKTDWELYGTVCYRHRAAVIKAISSPMQPSEIKRRALTQNPHLRMSANNVRDVIKFLLKTGIVQQVRIPKKAHPRYELTTQGKHHQTLLFRAWMASSF